MAVFVHRDAALDIAETALAVILAASTPGRPWVEYHAIVTATARRAADDIAELRRPGATPAEEPQAGYTFMG